MMNFRKKEKDYSREEMLANLRLAHKEWKDKENYFESVTDPDLIDYAIYDMEASKLKYIYLLKQMKEWDMSSALQEESKDEDISISG
ncbi:DUF2508 family protein [Tissierella sp.]|uniref:DUF2508 family protein n=1 Tax=Tissierella sp. TaxID=41274 RepID=UPI0028ABF1AF|nr:DUF2508 family protein [Tissierella sp.]